MDSQRAMEILQSQALINLSYRGIPVYLQEIDAERQMAIVFPLDEMDNEQEVDIGGLHEV